MTTPLDHGYPDWGRQRAAADILLVNINFTQNINGDTDYGPFQTAGMDYLNVWFEPGVAARIRMTWYTDAAASIEVGQDYIDCFLTPEGRGTIPVRGAFVVIRVQLTAYPNTFRLKAHMTSVRSNQGSPTSGRTNLVSVDGVSVPAATTRTDNCLLTRGGWIYWNADLEGGLNFRFRLYAVDYLGTTYLLDHTTNLNRQGGRLVFAPAMGLQVVAQNAEPATARNYFLAVTFHPYQS